MYRSVKTSTVSQFRRGPPALIGGSRDLAKGRQVVLIVIETTGAVHPDAVGMLYAWHAETRAEGCIDRTVYGTSRTATTSFFTHHLRLISLAAVIGAALPVAIWAKSRKSHLLRGAPLAGLLPVVM